jgi:hypothetical protein
MTYSIFRIHWIIYGLSFDYLGIMSDYIMYYLTPALGDYVDNRMVIFGQKKGESPHLEDPPPQKFRPSIFRGPPLWKSQEV